MSYLPSVERELMDALDRALDGEPVMAPATRPSRRARWGRRPRRLTLVLALAVLGLGGVAGAVVVLPTGDPVGPPSPEAVPGSEQLAGLAIPDPVDGPPWDIEFFTSRNGQSCAQIGRTAEGRFGVLGADGALHPMPPGSGAWGCAGRPGDPLDASGLIATSNAGVNSVRSPCDSAGNDPCDEHASRVFVFGVLGPDARSLTFAPPDGATTNVPLGRHGAFLLIAEGRGPIRGTLTATWQDGHTTSGSTMLGADGREPFLARP